jgi:cytochrome oxidase Cu insertion factor (SCO1/SenC/PrrC family)
MKTIALSIALIGIASAVLAEDGLTSRTAEYDYDSPVPGTYALPVIKPAADGALLDVNGQPVRLRALTHGRITVMSFIYTRCAAAKACPYATGVLLELHRISAADAALAKQMRLVSMSFDPMNDTPERMANYSGLSEQYPNAAPWHFVTTRSQTELQPILDAYGQAVDRKKNPLDPTGPLNHSLRVFLVDQNGNIRNIYSSDTLDIRLVLADVRTLILENSNATRTPPASAGVPRSSEKIFTVSVPIPIQIFNQL